MSVGLGLQHNDTALVLHVTNQTNIYASGLCCDGMFGLELPPTVFQRGDTTSMSAITGVVTILFDMMADAKKTRSPRSDRNRQKLLSLELEIHRNDWSHYDSHTRHSTPPQLAFSYFHVLPRGRYSFEFGLGVDACAAIIQSRA